MIVITGATGGLNGATLSYLLRDRDPGEIAIVSRDPDQAQPLADRLGVRVRRGDYASPDSLKPAFEGADQLLLVSTNDASADALALHGAAIDAAADVGVGRILYTSHQGAAPDTPFGPGRDHFETEQLLAASGVPWVALRNGFYLHSLTWLTGPWQETGAISVPADGPVSWTARDDAAKAAAKIIDSEGGWEGPVTITAPRASTFEDVATIASDLTGRAITCDVVGDEAWVAAQVESGRPEHVARFTLGMYHAAAEGYFAGTDPLLETLLGTAPRSVRDELEAPAV